MAPVGENLESVFTAIRDFPTEKIYLVSKGKHLDRIDELKSVADRLKIDVQVVDPQLGSGLAAGREQQDGGGEQDQAQ